MPRAEPEITRLTGATQLGADNVAAQTGRPWNDVEGDLRSTWDRHSTRSKWDEVKDAVDAVQRVQRDVDVIDRQLNPPKIKVKGPRLKEEEKKLLLKKQKEIKAHVRLMIDELEERGETLQHRWACLIAARCRGLLSAARGDFPDAFSALERAFDLARSGRFARASEIVTTSLTGSFLEPSQAIWLSRCRMPGLRKRASTAAM